MSYLNLLLDEDGTPNPNIVLPKPVNSIGEKDQQRVEILDASNQLIITVKEDGHMYPTTIGKGGPRLFSKSFSEKTLHAPDLIEQIRAVQYPENSLFMNELVHLQNGQQDRFRVGEIMSGSISPALEKQNKMGSVSMITLMPIIWGGKDLTKVNVATRMNILQEHHARYGSDLDLIKPVEIFHGSLADARAESVRRNLEGLVLYDSDSCATDKKPYLRIDGRTDLPKRMDGVWKDKDELEDDFVIYGKRLSTTRPGEFKDFLVGQYCPETGQIIHCGKVGKGFSYAQRAQFMELKFPCTIQVAFEMWTKYNILSHTKFVELRPESDKQHRACIFKKNKSLTRQITDKTVSIPLEAANKAIHAGTWK
jgi:hypothetical protein